MLKNYFKIAWRNLAKQKMYGAIKIGGFALGIAACLLIALFIRNELSYDRHYPGGENIYRVIGLIDIKGKVEKGTAFPAPMAAALKEDFPEVEKAGRYLPSELFGAGSNQIRRTDKQQNTYEEGFVYADQEFLDILKIPFVYGNPVRALDEPQTMVLSRRMAEKYFPGENPLGKTMILNNHPDRLYKVGGVMEDPPVNSHFQYDFLLSLKGVEFDPGEQTNWVQSNYFVYVQLRDGTDAGRLSKKMSSDVINNYMIPARKNAGRTGVEEMFKNASLVLQPLREIHLRSEGMDDGLAHGDIRLVWLFGAVAGFILLIACINFINLSTAKSAGRAMEVGLRKAIGSGRGSLIGQYLTESLLYSVLSFVAGMLLAWGLLPYFNSLAGKSLIFPWGEWWLLPLLVGAAIITGMLAGLYPAFYLSAFKPVEVLKGSVGRNGKSSGMRSALVVFQFTASIALIIGTFIIHRQMGYILHKKLGFEKEQVLLLQGVQTLDDKIYTFKKELRALPDVENASVSDYLPVSGTLRNGNSFWKEGRSAIDDRVAAQKWRVDHDYIKTMGMHIVEGRDFSIELPTDSQAVIINQTMARELGLKEAIGQRITNNGDISGFPVIGVVEDFHFESLKEDIGALCLIIGNSPNIISVKVNTADMPNLLQALSSLWKDFSPDQPLRYTFLDERYARMYEDVQRTGNIFSSFALLAIVVACLGLLGLSAFTAEQRTKEIGVRKVLGASVQNVVMLLSRDFIKLVLIAILIAVPLAWYAMNRWLQDFAYSVEMEWWMFALAGLLAVVIALLTVSFQSVKAALMNPVKALRSE